MFITDPLVKLNVSMVVCEYERGERAALLIMLCISPTIMVDPDQGPNTVEAPSVHASIALFQFKSSSLTNF